MPRKLFAFAPTMGYWPSEEKERLVLHVCKGSDTAGSARHCLYDAADQPFITTTYAWDNGSGRSIGPLASVFAGAKKVHVVSDASPLGVVALNNVVDLLNKCGARWKHLGVSDRWLRAIPEASRELWIKSRSMPFPREMKDAPMARIRKLAAAADLGSRCRALIDSGRVIELEAFLHPEYRLALRRAIRST